MNISTSHPEQEYPRIVLWDPEYLPLKYEKKDLVIMSMITDPEDSSADMVHYVQYLDGHEPGHVTRSPEEYHDLPKGFEITLKQ